MAVRYEGHFSVQVVAVPRCRASFHENLSVLGAPVVLIGPRCVRETGLEILSQIGAERKFAT